MIKKLNLKNTVLLFLAFSILILSAMVYNSPQKIPSLEPYRDKAKAIDEVTVIYKNATQKKISLPGNVYTTDEFKMIIDLSKVPVEERKCFSLFTTFLKFDVSVMDKNLDNDRVIYQFNESNFSNIKSGGWSLNLIDLPEDIDTSYITIDFTPIFKDKNIDVYNFEKMYVGSPLKIAMTLFKGKNMSLSIFDLILFIIAVISFMLAILSKIEYTRKSFLRLGSITFTLAFYLLPQIFSIQLFFPRSRLIFHVIDYTTLMLLPILLFSFVRGKFSPRKNIIIDVFFYFTIFYLLIMIWSVILGYKEFRFYLKGALLLMIVEALVVMIIYFTTKSEDYPKKKEVVPSTILMIGMSFIASFSAFFTEYFFGTRDLTLLLYIFLALELVSNSRSFLSVQQKSVEKDIYKKMALSDPLTKLGSRTAYEETLETNRDNAFWVLSMDLNDLKKMNDNFGHMAGDTLIKNFAELLKISFPKDADLFRTGGDEFMAFLYIPKETDMDKIIEEMRKTGKKIGGEYSPSFALGYAYYSGSESDDLMKVIVLADNLMYANKKTMKECNLHRNN